MKGTAYYCGDNVSILEVSGDKALIIKAHNPIDSDWVKVADLDMIVWIINSKVA